MINPFPYPVTRMGIGKFLQGAVAGLVRAAMVIQPTIRQALSCAAGDLCPITFRGTDGDQRLGKVKTQEFVFDGRVRHYSACRSAAAIDFPNR